MLLRDLLQFPFCAHSHGYSDHWVSLSCKVNWLTCTIYGVIQLLNYIKPQLLRFQRLHCIQLQCLQLPAGGKKAAKTHTAASAPRNPSPMGIDFAFCETSFNLSFSLGGYDHWVSLTCKVNWLTCTIYGVIQLLNYIQPQLLRFQRLHCIQLQGLQLPT